jgi:hypothetical protein
MIDGQSIYRSNEHSFDFLPVQSGDTSLLIGYLQIMVDSETRLVKQIWGLHPKTTWSQSALSLPKSRRGELLVTTDVKAGNDVRIVEEGEWATTYDNALGWICIGDYSKGPLDEAVEFANGVIAVVNRSNLKAIWIHPVFVDE